jgi:hypothetical protein
MLVSVLRRLVGRFEALFGTQRGALLQEYARNISVGLAWSFDNGHINNMAYTDDKTSGDTPFYSELWNGTHHSNQRLLDVTVLTDTAFTDGPFTINATGYDGNTSLSFVHLWAEVALMRDRGLTPPASPAELEAVWNRLVNATPLSLQVRPPQPLDCANWTSCFGLNAAGECVCYSPSLASALPPHIPVSPDMQRQSVSQRNAIATVRAQAAAPAKLAAPQLLDYLDSSEFRGTLKRCCSQSGVAEWSAQQLLDELHANLEAAEIMHQFDGGGNTAGMDLTISLGRNLSFFPSMRQVMYMQAGKSLACHTPPTGTMTSSERILFDVGPADCGADGNTATMSSFSTGLVYGLLNLFRASAGYAAYGDVIGILSPSYWKDALVVTPADSGSWYDSCVNSPESPTMCLNLTRAHVTELCSTSYTDARSCLNLMRNCFMNCDDWPLTNNTGSLRKPGVYGSMDHVLLAHQRVWAGEGRDQFGRLFARWHGDSEAETNISTRDLYGYMESNIVGNVLYKEKGLKFLVGRFEALFGTAKGRSLREWAQELGVAVAWSFDNGYVTHAEGGESDTVEAQSQSTNGTGTYWSPAWNGTFRSSGRLLDVPLLSVLNVSVDSSVSYSFNELWSSVQAARDRNSSAELSQDVLAAFWQRAQRALPAAVYIRPPVPGDCADWSTCLGLNGAGKCACYASNETALAE